MRYWFMTTVVVLAFTTGMGVNAAGPDAKELAAKGHGLFLQVLAGDRAKLPEAINAMEQSREADPRYAFNLYNLGRIYFFNAIGQNNLGALNKAEPVFAQIMEIDPKNTRAMAFHG